MLYIPDGPHTKSQDQNQTNKTDAGTDHGFPVSSGTIRISGSSEPSPQFLGLYNDQVSFLYT